MLTGCRGKLGINREWHPLFWVSEELEAGSEDAQGAQCFCLGPTDLGQNKESKSAEHTFIQVEVQKHVPNPNAYMWFLQILLLRDESNPLPQSPEVTWSL